MASSQSIRIQDLRASFGGKLTEPTDPDYDSARAVWNGSIDGRPAAVASCASAADVAAAIRFARANGLEIAVRGGGHSYPGFGTCDGGLVIDLGSMKRIEVDPEARTARVEPGATWADLDAATHAHGLATTGGLISSTGVAGLTLGGGIGWLMRAHGLACDNLLSATMVTADGKTVEARADHNPELLWGLRGGGGNFGVVTEFVFHLHPVSTVLGGLIAFTADRAGEVLRAYRDLVKGLPDEITTLWAYTSAPPAPFVPAELQLKRVAAVALCHLGNADAGQALLQPLRDLKPAFEMVAPMPYPALQSMLDGGAPRGIQNYFKGSYLSGLSDAAVDEIVMHCEKMASPLSQAHLHHLGGAVARVGEDATAVGSRDAQFILNSLAAWFDPGQTSLHTSLVRGFQDGMKPYGTGHTYVNFLSETTDADVRSAYEERKYSRLSALKRTYDPDNVFHLNQNIKPTPA